MPSFDLEVRIIYRTKVTKPTTDKLNHHSKLFPTKCILLIMDTNKTVLKKKDSLAADGSQNIQTTACASGTFLTEIKLVKQKVNL